MQIEKVHFAYFTPIQATRRIAYCVASGMCTGLPSAQYNLTAVSERKKEYHISSNEVLLAAIPAYAGRAPQVNPSLLRNMHGEGGPAVVVATYGNRAYEDTLLDMQTILKEQGFVTVAGAAFITVHAMSAKVGAGRPDLQDLTLAREFGTQVRKKLDALEGPPVPVSLPGNTPLMQLPPPMGISPITTEQCVLCMQCYRWCPTDAITYNDPNETDASRCVLCQGCVVRCPVDARQVVNETFLQRVTGLEENFVDVRCEPEMFF